MSHSYHTPLLIEILSLRVCVCVLCVAWLWILMNFTAVTAGTAADAALILRGADPDIEMPGARTPTRQF